MWNTQQAEAEYRREQLVQDWGTSTGSGWWRRLVGLRAVRSAAPTRTASSVVPAAANRPVTEHPEPRIPVQTGPAENSREERTTVGSSAA